MARSALHCLWVGFKRTYPIRKRERIQEEGGKAVHMLSGFATKRLCYNMFWIRAHPLQEHMQTDPSLTGQKKELASIRSGSYRAYFALGKDVPECLWYAGMHTSKENGSFAEQSIVLALCLLICLPVLFGSLYSCLNVMTRLEAKNQQV
jgi:hypothetical protein